MYLDSSPVIHVVIGCPNRNLTDYLSLYLLVLTAWHPTLSDPPISPEDPNLAPTSHVIDQAISLRGSESKAKMLWSAPSIIYSHLLMVDSLV